MVRHPGRWRHSVGACGMSIWLIIAQLTLFGAAGLTHTHAILPGGGSPAAWSEAASSASQRACLKAAGGTQQHGTSHCVICQSARSTVVSLVAVPVLPAAAAPGEQAAALLSCRLRSAPTSPCSARAPPSSASTA